MAAEHAAYRVRHTSAMALAVLWLVVGVVVGAFGWAASDGRLVRRSGSDAPARAAARDAAQRAGGPILLGAGALIGTMGFLLAVFRPGGDVPALVSLFLGAGLVGAAVGAVVVGSRAGRSAAAEYANR